MTDLAIQTKKLTRRYGEKNAVDNLTFTVPKGEVFGFLGHNGAGKTTTISMLTTLLLPTSGTAEIFGKDIIKDNLAVREYLGYVPENVRLYDDMSVSENLAFFSALSKVKDAEKRTAEVLDLIGHPEWRDLKVGSLSKGMRQRIGLAQALLHHPEILFLDEPSSGLDPEGTHAIRDLITFLNREMGITIFMNTHQLSEVTKICTSIGIMNHGRLVVADKLSAVLARFPDHTSLEEIYLNIESRQSDGKEIEK